MTMAMGKTDDNGDGKNAEAYNSGFLTDIARNREQAERIDHIDFSNHGVQVQIVSDVEVTGEAGTTLVDENKIKKFARNQEELNKMMTEFCEKLLTGFEKISVTNHPAWISLSIDGRIFGILRNRGTQSDTLLPQPPQI